MAVETVHTDRFKSPSPDVTGMTTGNVFSVDGLRLLLVLCTARSREGTFLCITALVAMGTKCTPLVMQSRRALRSSVRMGGLEGAAGGAIGIEIVLQGGSLKGDTGVKPTRP